MAMMLQQNRNPLHSKIWHQNPQKPQLLQNMPQPQMI